MLDIEAMTAEKSCRFSMGRQGRGRRWRKKEGSAAGRKTIRGESIMCAEKKCCCTGEKHQGHLCVLHSKGLTDDIACVTSAPTVVCFTCGREANTADNVCSPMPLEKK
jgi:hypothetical protein